MISGDEPLTEETEVPVTSEEEQTQSDKSEPSAEAKEEDNSSQELVKLLRERLTMYETAEQKARRENESGRARRYNRGVKTLKEMLVSAQAGRPVAEADIPPILPQSAVVESTEPKNTGDISRIYCFANLQVYQLPKINYLKSNF